MKPFVLANVAILTGILTVGFIITCTGIYFTTKFFYPTIHLAF